MGKRVCIGCEEHAVRPGELGEHEDCMMTEAMAGCYLYCQACFDEAP